MELGATYEVSRAGSVYEAVLPVLVSTLATPKTRDELFAELEVRKAQIDDWLKRAVKEGRVYKKGRPVKYHATSGLEAELPLN